ncbi:helix-turn-helix transcriptional regulator [uncultured Senegalimassilia sp.]|uniref:helix-turn-helix domain-containing protein n=1 Tax=uncultured Senegalimassilia sp. TaxID=1714350 RepID=UPI002639C2E7|nr:helix-turn-helix transcriptional regulator [uncultured Senegalimassilia sp.]
MTECFDAAVVARNIKARRIAKGFGTQEELARRSGLSPQAISSWESQRSVPNGKSIVVLACALDCTADELLGLDGGGRRERH